MKAMEMGAAGSAPDVRPNVRSVRTAGSLTRVDWAEFKRLRRQLAAAQARIAELEKLADTDPLTSTFNRRAFERHVAGAISIRERHGLPSALLFVDLDGLKVINDQLGHAAGDAAILHIAKVLQANVRSSDIVGRLGGDEFAVLLFHADTEQACAKADYLHAAFCAKPVAFDGGLLPVSASVGVCALLPGDTAASVLARADEAMYARKRQAAA